MAFITNSFSFLSHLKKRRFQQKYSFFVQCFVNAFASTAVNIQKKSINAFLFLTYCLFACCTYVRMYMCSVFFGNFHFHAECLIEMPKNISPGIAKPGINFPCDGTHGWLSLEIWPAPSTKIVGVGLAKLILT